MINFSNRKLVRIFDLVTTHLQTLKVERTHNRIHKIGGKGIKNFYDNTIAEWQEILDAIKKELE